VVASVAWSIPIYLEDDRKNDKIKIAEISGVYAAVGAVALGWLAAATAAVVMLPKGADEIKALREDKQRLEGRVEKMGIHTQCRFYLTSGD